MSKAPGDQISLIFFFNYLHMYIFFEYYFCEKNPIDNETKHEVFLQRYFLSLKLKRMFHNTFYPVSMFQTCDN